MDSSDLEGMSPDELDAYSKRCKEIREALDRNYEKWLGASARFDQVKAALEDERAYSLDSFLRMQAQFYLACQACRIATDERDQLHQEAFKLGLDVPPSKPNQFERYQ